MEDACSYHEAVLSKEREEEEARRAAEKGQSLPLPFAEVAC